MAGLLVHDPMQAQAGRDNEFGFQADPDEVAQYSNGGFGTLVPVQPRWINQNNILIQESFLPGNVHGFRREVERNCRIDDLGVFPAMNGGQGAHVLDSADGQPEQPGDVAVAVPIGHRDIFDPFDRRGSAVVDVVRPVNEFLVSLVL